MSRTSGARRMVRYQHLVTLAVMTMVVGLCVVGSVSSVMHSADSVEYRHRVLAIDRTT